VPGAFWQGDAHDERDRRRVRAVYVLRETFGRDRASGRTGDTLAKAIAFDLRDGPITHVRVVVNPDKLEFVRLQLACS
jgi:RNA polymerase sigma-70 factor (ECF subfamily)